MADSSLASLAANFPWFTFLLAWAISAAAVTVLIPVARLAGWVDKPNARKSHVGEVPLVGGWALLLAVLALQLLGPSDNRAPTGFLVGALLLFSVALVDDRFPIRARYRFMVQFAAAVAAVSMGGEVLPGLGNFLGTGTVSAWWLMGPVSVIGIIGVVNAVNFTDGADGLCGGIGFIGLLWFVVAVTLGADGAAAAGVAAAPFAAAMVPLAAALMGGLGGFLLFNHRVIRRKAAVFLGDSGSMLVGFSLAWFSIHATSAYGVASVSPVACLWIMAVPLADAVSCFLRRIIAGETPMRADLKHLHHLLMKAGLPVATAVAIIHAAAFVCGLIGVGGWMLGVPERVMFLGFAGALIAFVAATLRAWWRLDGSRVVARSA